MGNLKKGSLPKGFHAGNLVAVRAKERNISFGELARRTKRAPVSIYRTLKSPNLSCVYVWHMSKALQYDVFADLSAQFMAAHTDVLVPVPAKGPDLQLQIEEKNEQILKQEKEISRLTEERDYLKKIIDLLAANAKHG